MLERKEALKGRVGSGDKKNPQKQEKILRNQPSMKEMELVLNNCLNKLVQS